MRAGWRFGGRAVPSIVPPEFYDDLKSILAFLVKIQNNDELKKKIFPPGADERMLSSNIEYCEYLLDTLIPMEIHSFDL